MSQRNGSQRNGKPKLPALRTLRANHERLTLAREVAVLEAQNQILETSLGNNDWGRYIDPHSRYRDDERDWMTVANIYDRKRGGDQDVYRNEEELHAIRTLARYLVRANPYASGMMRQLTNFTIRKGFTYKSEPEPEYKEDKQAAKLADRVQVFIDRWIDLNVWPKREREMFRRTERDGESIGRLFPREDGLSIWRFVEPEFVKNPANALEEQGWTFGIKHKVDAEGQDVETIEKYWISYSADSSKGEEIDAAQVFHLKMSDTDSTLKRGLSGFFSTRDAFHDAAKLNHNMSVGASILAAIAYITQTAGVTQAQLQAYITGQSDAVRQNASMGRTEYYRREGPGQVVHVGEGREYKAPPMASNSPHFVAILAAALRCAAARWNMPEFMVSSDASNANYASTLVSGSPFVTAVECEQDHYVQMFAQIIWRAIEIAAKADWFRPFKYEDILAMVAVHIEPPQVAIANRIENATVHEIQHRNGVLSKQTWRMREGLDNDEEKAKLEEEPPTPSQPGAPPGGLPSPLGGMGGGCDKRPEVEEGRAAVVPFVRIA